MSKRMTESQIVAILKEAEAGMPVKDLCRKFGIGPFFQFTCSGPGGFCMLESHG